MKIISANNSNKFDFSTRNWLKIKRSKQSNSLKKSVNDSFKTLSKISQESQGSNDFDKYYDSLQNLDISKSVSVEDEEDSTHFIQSPSSPWGGKEVYDGENILRSYKCLISGNIFIPDSILNSEGNLTKNVEQILEKDIKTYHKDGIISELSEELDQTIYQNPEEQQEIDNINVNIRSLVSLIPNGNEYKISFELNINSIGFLDEYELKTQTEDMKAEQELG